MIPALLAGLFIQTHSLLPFPGLHSPFHWAEMILRRQHKRELCGPSKCAFSAGESGGQDGGRWGEKVGSWWRGTWSWGREKPNLMTRLQLSWNNRDIMTLWTHKNTQSHSRTGTVTHHLLIRNWDLHFKPVLNVVIPTPVRLENLKLLSQVTQLNIKNWAKIATSEILCSGCPALDQQFDGK